MNTPTQHTGGESATPRTDAAFALKEIEELALAIRRNLHEDAAPAIQDDKWVITAAAHALCILDNTATLRAQIARLQQREGELVGALKTIASYDEHSKHGEGICPYGCDTPHIARAVLQSVAKEGEQ